MSGTRRALALCSLFAAIALTSGCPGPVASTDAGGPDVGSDASAHDGGSEAAVANDAGTDAATDDAATPDDAFAIDAALAIDVGTDAINDANVEPTVNGCTRTTASDLTGQATAAITFPTGGLTYAPPCIRVSLGTQVTFNGAFASHPLQAGTVVGTTLVPQTSGTPLPTTSLSTGTTATFAMTPVGTYGYYCAFHGSFGMMGTIYVE